MKASIVLSLGVLSIALGACGTGPFSDRNKIDVTNSSAEAPPPAEASFTSFELLDTPASNDGVFVGSIPTTTAENIGISMGDPSVTIFPLDGEPLIGVSPTIGASAIPRLDTGRAFNNNNTASSFSPARNGVSERDTVIYFNHGSSRLGSGDIQKLSQVAETAKFSPVDRVKVEGHASSRAQTSDPIRNSILNLKESMNRAFVVSKTLIEKGVPAEKLKTTAFGDTVPAANEAEQRRVDIVTGAGL